MNKDFHVTHEDKREFVLQHPDGHSLRIAKSGLSPDSVKKIQEFACGGQVQNFDVGGIAQGQPADSPDFQLPLTATERYRQAYAETQDRVQAGRPGQPPVDPSLISQITLKDLSDKDSKAEKKKKEAYDYAVRQNEVNAQTGARGTIPVPQQAGAALPQKSGTLASNSPSAPSPGLETIPIPQDLTTQPTQSIPGMIKNPAGSIMGAARQQIAGINEEAAAQGELGQRQAGVWGDEAAQQKSLADTTSNNLAGLQTHFQDIRDDIHNQHLDYGRIWNNKNFGQKAFTILGMIISGAGGATIGQPDAVGAMLDKQIQDDILQQKDELGKKQNMLSEYTKMYGNVTNAQQVLALSYKAATAAKIEQMASQMADPIAKARAKAAAGKIMMEAIPATQKAAMDMAKYQAESGAGGMENYLDKDQRERIVPLPNGQHVSAYTADGAKDARELLTVGKNINSGLDELEKIGPSAMLKVGPQAERAKALVSGLTTDIQKFAGLTRMSPEVLKIIHNQIDDPTHWREVFSHGAKSDALRANIERHQNNFLQSNIIGGYRALTPPKKLATTAQYNRGKK